MHSANCTVYGWIEFMAENEHMLNNQRQTKMSFQQLNQQISFFAFECAPIDSRLSLWNVVLPSCVVVALKQQSTIAMTNSCQWGRFVWKRKTTKKPNSENVREKKRAQLKTSDSCTRTSCTTTESHRQTMYMRDFTQLKSD